MWAFFFFGGEGDVRQWAMRINRVGIFWASPSNIIYCSHAQPRRKSSKKGEVHYGRKPSVHRKQKRLRETSTRKDSFGRKVSPKKNHK